jgi:hypothetical protein
LAFAFGWSEAPAQESPPAREQSGPQTIAPDRLGAQGTADISRTRAVIAEVLAQPEFVDLRADPHALQRLIAEWFLSLFERVRSAVRHLPHWLLWIVVAWMILTLLAILAHLIYTLWRLLGGFSLPSAAGSSARRRGGELLGIRDLNFDTVYAEACRLVTAGDWRAATRYYYVAAILWLDRQGAIAFRPSKTNRDYIGELRAQTGLRGPFGRLTEHFEAIIYAGQAATASTSRDMADILDCLTKRGLAPSNFRQVRQ